MECTEDINGVPADGSRWGDITHEALVEIFSRLDLEDRWKRTSLVCKGWLNASKDPFLWREVDLEKYFHSNTETSLWWTSEFQARIDAMVKRAADNSGAYLTSFSVRHCSDDSLRYLAQRCPNLEYLSIRACQGITDASICEIASGCPLIKELDISYCHHISCASLEQLGLHCKNLTTLKRNMLNTLDPSEIRNVVPREYINAFPLGNDEEAASIAKLMPNLKHVELQFSKLSVNGLKVLIKGCPSLEYLDLFGCSNLSGRAINQACEMAKNLKTIVKPNFFVPASAFHVVRYGHWQLYDERFQTSVFQI